MNVMRMSRTEEAKGISAVVCTYNGASRIVNTLGAFRKQVKTDGIPWEVILVDNASKDDTSDVARELMKDSDVDFSLLFEARPGKNNAIETGFAKAKYDYLCIVDDDNWVCDDYISKVYSIMSENPDVGICGANGTGEFEVPPPAWINEFKIAYGIGPQSANDGYLPFGEDCLYGAASAIRKSAWLELKERGFVFTLSGRKGKTLASGEDMELSQAMLLLGYKLWYSSSLEFRHYMPAGRITWPYMCRLSEAFGRSDVITNQYRIYLNTLKPVYKYIYRYYVLHLCYAFYQYLKSYPLRYLFKQKVREGKLELLLYLRFRAYFIELLRSGYKLPMIRSNIRKML